MIVSAAQNVNTKPADIADELPDRAQVVIIGGGVTGCSIAFHLTELGCNDVILLERRQLGCGTTWHSQGLVGLVRANPAMTRMALATNEVLQSLEARTGLSTGFRQPGTLIYCTQQIHRQDLQRLAARQKPLGIDIRAISVAEAQERWPLLNTDDVVGAFFMAQEGQTNPLDTVQAYARAARLGGARIRENTRADCMVTQAGRIHGVGVGSHVIEAEFVVNAAGIWSRELGQKVGIELPVLPVQQSYFVTEPVPGVEPGLPILRNFHDDVLIREDAGQLTIGATSRIEKLWGLAGIPEDFCFDELPLNLEALEPWVERILHRLPILADVGVRRMLTGPECVSPDACYYLGEHPELARYFVAVGMSGVGVGSSGGIGQAMASWIVNGSPPVGLDALHMKRARPGDGALESLVKTVPRAAGSLFELFD